MAWLNRLPGSRSSAPGLEQKILRILPRLTLASTAIAGSCYLLARGFPSPAAGVSVEKYLSDVRILAVASLLTVYTALLTIAIGCVIVYLMKGHGYVADPYPLIDADHPGDKQQKSKR